MDRREVASRKNPFIQKMAAHLAQSRITANQISVFSVGAALLVPIGLQLLPLLKQSHRMPFGELASTLGIFLALLGVQLRLLANVLDGLVAIEGGRASALGALYNELPDRLSDSVILVSLGYALHQPTLGWLCALLAALTAYIRVTGGALGLPQSFVGPFAKQHRMALVTLILLASFLPADTAYATQIVGLAVMAVGTGITCIRRTLDIASSLENKSGSAT